MTRGRWNTRTTRITGLAVVLAVPAFVLAGSPVSAAPTVKTTKGGHQHAAPLPAPPQMKALDPLLGKWKCDEAAAPDQQFIINATRGLDGHYQNETVTIDPGGVRAVASYGWNPLDQVYFSQYHDNWGSSSSTTSPGWKDGHLIFTGEVIQIAAPDATGHATGAHMQLKDDYTLVRPGYFKSTTTVSLNGVDYPHSYDCHTIK
jgi:hypothetical protein